MAELVDRSGRQVRLGEKIGHGGEGAVYRLPDHAHLVAKIYHTPPSAERIEKLKAMAQGGTSELMKLACWPVELLSDASGGRVQGFLMPNAGGLKEVHKLYSPKSRNVEFQSVDWRFLVAAAANIARAFAVIHRSGHVIGDVNHSSVCVAPDATVRLIDCDSFQIQAAGRSFPCEVAEPFHTPPELQGKALRGIVRTANHDNFGLAVLVFELLFMGRHPYAGAFLGSGDPSLEQKIGRFLFAYGSGAPQREMRQPPNTLALEAASPSIAALFERAFLQEGVISRPTAAEWVGELVALQGSLKRCAREPGHAFFQSLPDCPWCEIEGRIGISLFSIAFAPVVNQGSFNLALVWESIHQAPKPKTRSAPPELAQHRTKPEQRFVDLRRRQSTIRRGAVFISLMIGLGSLALPIAPGIGIGFAVFVALVALGASAMSASQVRKKAEIAFKSAKEASDRINEQWKATASASLYRDAIREIGAKHREYQELPAFWQAEMDRLVANLRDRQAQQFLDRYRIKPGVIPGIGSGRCTTLSSYGIETAADVNAGSVMAVPGFGEQLTAQLVAWRASVERQFRFDPSKGVDKADVRKLDAMVASKRAALEKELLGAPAALRQLVSRMENADRALGPAMDAACAVAAQMKANLEAL